MTRKSVFKPRVLLAQALIFILAIFGQFGCSLAVSAVGSLFTADDICRAYYTIVPPSGSATTASFPSYANVTDALQENLDRKKDDYTDKYNAQKVLALVTKVYPDSASYDTATKDIVTYCTYDIQTRSLVAQNISEKEQERARNAIQSFNSGVSNAVARQQFEEIYSSDEWDPSNVAAKGMLSWFYVICNNIFYVTCQLVVWWFVIQTAFDGLYLVCDPIRPYIISPKKTGGNTSYGSSDNSSRSVLKRLCLPICSKAVAEATSGEDSKSGSYGKGNASSSNPFVVYLVKRAPTFIMLAVYLILVQMGYWTKIIGAVASVVSSLLNGILEM